MPLGQRGGTIGAPLWDTNSAPVGQPARLGCPSLRSGTTRGCWVNPVYQVLVTFVSRRLSQQGNAQLRWHCTWPNCEVRACATEYHNKMRSAGFGDLQCLLRFDNDGLKEMHEELKAAGCKLFS